MKLLGSTKSKITKSKNRENLPHLKITEAVLVYFQQQLWKKKTKKKQGISIHLFLIILFGQLLDISPKKHLVNILKFVLQIKILDHLSLHIKNDALFNWTKKSNWIFVNNYKNMGKTFGKNISKISNGKYSQNLLDHAKKPVTDIVKTTSKKQFQKLQKKRLI